LICLLAKMTRGRQNTKETFKRVSI